MTAPQARTALPRTPDGVAALVRLLLADLDPLTDRLVAAILAEDPTYADRTRTPLADLRRSCLDNLRRLLQAMTAELGEGDDPLDAPRETGSRRAEQGVPLESVLHAYRLGYRIIWEGLVREARSGRPDVARSVDALVDAASVVWEIIDLFSAAVAGSYRETEAGIARRDADRRDATLDALLDGRGVDRSVAADAAAALDLPEHGPYAVLVVTGEAAVQAADALSVRGLRAAWRQRADRVVGLVSLGAGAPGDVVDALRVLPGARGGVSPVVDGLAEVDVGQALASSALRALSPGRAEVVELDAVLPGALLVTAPDLAGRLLRRALGGLLGLEDPERELLLGTLAAWLDAGGSAGQTAARLYCHRNTVLNRLRRIESLTGRSLERVDHLVEWSLALLALELLPDGAHPP